jgi:hypothetical protein
MIAIFCQPENPVEYLGSMGVYAIADCLDKTTKARWTSFGFELETAIPEKELLSVILEPLQDFARWGFTPSLSVDRASSNITTEVRVPFSTFTARLNFWYETASASFEDPVTVSMDNSAWKFFAGRQKIPATIKIFVEKIGSEQFNSLTDLLAFRAPVDGRFGFDPTACRNALDVGYSPDKLGTPVPTSVAAELLSLIGVQYCFPPRCKKGARGWTARTKEQPAGFSYSVWPEWLPFILGRHVACTDAKTRLFSEARKRDRYKNLSFAKEM